ncbi:hypothetical protein [Pseudoroseicyclus aestuarii]|uniref:Uncharacterized protein n=1 Tax=Pseudoroseicyclus aestuarii TaxID=1795041 RepID=A0A318SRK0_9RHOB|nr:hypothetical protein [Pseudoroseicyclus aestuarii]PYE80862.1 hypothetical protein DFP88_11026 [Pseudoroseicyclus aestuarii]
MPLAKNHLSLTIKFAPHLLRQLLPFANLLNTPLDEPGEGMVIRLHALMNRVLEQLDRAEAERSEIAELSASFEERAAALEETVDRQHRMTADMQRRMIEMQSQIAQMHALLCRPAD